MSSREQLCALTRLPLFTSHNLCVPGWSRAAAALTLTVAEKEQYRCNFCTWMTHTSSINKMTVIVINVLSVLTSSGCRSRSICGTSRVFFTLFFCCCALRTVNEWSDKQKLRWKEDLRTHLIRLTSNAPPDAVSKCELTRFAFSIFEMQRKARDQQFGCLKTSF